MGAAVEEVLLMFGWEAPHCRTASLWAVAAVAEAIILRPPSVGEVTPMAMSDVSVTLARLTKTLVWVEPNLPEEMEEYLMETVQTVCLVNSERVEMVDLEVVPVVVAVVIMAAAAVPIAMELAAAADLPTTAVWMPIPAIPTTPEPETDKLLFVGKPRGRKPSIRLGTGCS